ncbi:hypothetical protein [Corynebacterium cystitidis]|uniref:Uncharacterized protein n=1 Tax=Corynebacterium cystitidis DSM 20524 TaxID=1121357 RepID=A0A1H9WAR0_9CORY|nr:hypothetical protein [Corynebacterium cystitidis]WJY82947.1 hypothetical protein CCYS_10175 [Corynebacterium cystitidis DSM 20524]SES30925.1 hypothetical protein SAMN05661109_02628 [Corynebacterium cystitidis DSM 20524]SNV68731.1 Uncharacterised protein [Corynebacterium cystitidis]
MINADRSRPARYGVGSLIILADTVTPVELEEISSGATFATSPEQVRHGQWDTVILVNLTALQVAQVLEILGEQHSLFPTTIEYWVNTTALSIIDGAVAQLSDLHLVSCETSSGWLRLTMSAPVSSATTVAHAEAWTLFRQGLAAGIALSSSALSALERSPAVPPSEDTSQSRRALRGSAAAALLSRLMAIAKPIRPYLPPTVVAYVYKLLEKLR